MLDRLLRGGQITALLALALLSILLVSGSATTRTTFEIVDGEVSYLVTGHAGEVDRALEYAGVSLSGTDRIPKHTVLAKKNLLCSTFAGNHTDYKKECRKDTGENGLIRLAGFSPQRTRTYRLLSFFLPLFPAPNRVSEIPQTIH